MVLIGIFIGIILLTDFIGIGHPQWDLILATHLYFHGWNETLIPYIFSIASPTHAVTPPALSFYRAGWGNNGQIKQLRNLFGHLLYVGSSYGGPLFFTHYSFLGLDPRNIRDQYTNYFTHNRNQTLVNREYCKSNPKKYNGYGENSWGLTASYSIPRS